MEIREPVVPADGYCPVCCALPEETCREPSGMYRDDHASRHPYPREEDTDA